MTERGAHTLSEIMSQPTVWQDAVTVFRQEAEAIRQFWASNPHDGVIFTGCGSTFYLAKIAAALFQQVAHKPATAYPGSEIALFPDLVFGAKANPLLVTVSRSGETTETVEATRVFKERVGNPAMTVTCYPESTLAKASDLVVANPTAQEQSLAQTRSFASMTVGIAAMAAMLADADLDKLDNLPSAAQTLLDTHGDLAKQLGEDASIERYFFLGTGALYGVAAEAMLKMKEMSLSYSEAYHMLEFRHGPMSMVNDKTLVVGLVSDEAAKHEAAVLRQMHERGARVLTLAAADHDDYASWSQFVHLNFDLPAALRPVVYLPVLQLMAYHRAMSRGLNPDQPENLVAVITLGDLTD